MQPPVQGKGTVCFPSRKPRIFLVAVGDRWLSLSPSSAFQCLLCRLRFRGSGFCGRRRTLTAPPVGQGGGALALSPGSVGHLLVVFPPSTDWRSATWGSRALGAPSRVLIYRHTLPRTQGLKTERKRGKVDAGWTLEPAGRVTSEVLLGGSEEMQVAGGTLRGQTCAWATCSRLALGGSFGHAESPFIHVL